MDKEKKEVKPKEDIMNFPLCRLACGKCQSFRLEILGITKTNVMVSSCLNCGFLSHIRKELFDFPTQQKLEPIKKKENILVG